MHTTIPPGACGIPPGNEKPRRASAPDSSVAAESLDWRGGAITIRPIGPDDGPRHRAFAGALAGVDIHMRFFSARRKLSEADLDRLIHIDPAIETAFVAVRTLPGGIEETLGVVRLVGSVASDEAELGIIVRSDLKARGLGHLLMQRMLAHVAAHGPRRVIALVLRENAAMGALATAHGFVVDNEASDSDALCYALEPSLRGASPAVLPDRTSALPVAA
ncbi:MAG: GNAT family N-acetyltransferase [Burkholderiales bacterium]